MAVPVLISNCRFNPTSSFSAEIFLKITVFCHENPQYTAINYPIILCGTRKQYLSSIPVFYGIVNTLII